MGTTDSPEGSTGHQFGSLSVFNNGSGRPSGNRISTGVDGIYTKNMEIKDRRYEAEAT
jgi:hypothetical protein